MIATEGLVVSLYHPGKKEGQNPTRPLGSRGTPRAGASGWYAGPCGAFLPGESVDEACPEHGIARDRRGQFTSQVSRHVGAEEPS
jgi:hypothetical protein